MKILEASGRVGGRVKDNFSLGPCVGLGAMFITGINNNPLTLLARQLGVSLRLTNEDCCELISEDGWRPDPVLDKKVEAHFNKALDKLAEWRKMLVGADVSLGGMYNACDGAMEGMSVMEGMCVHVMEGLCVNGLSLSR